MSDQLDFGRDDSGRFLSSKLRPDVEMVIGRKRTALIRSLIAGAAVFLVFLIGIFLFFSPYLDMLGQHNIRYWPLFILLPVTMGVIAFSLVYIISLRSVVGGLRRSLMTRLAEYMGKDVVHVADRPIPTEELEQSLLFENLGKPTSGSDNFRGHRGTATFEMVEIRVAVQDTPTLGGIFFSAHFERRLPALLLVLTGTNPISLSALEKRLVAMNFNHADELVRLDVPGYPLQLVTRPRDQEPARRLLAAVFFPELLVFCHQRGLDPYLSCLGDRLSMALLRPVDPRNSGFLDSFDITGCRELCRQAQMSLGVLDELQRNMTIWEAKVN